MDKNNKCSEKTKRKIASALCELMVTVPFEKITVSDITTKCNIHRQTFYYHFQDRYELLDWILHNDILEPFITDLTLDNIYDRLYNLFETMNNNKEFYQNAININGDDLSRYISRAASEQFAVVIREIGLKHGIDNGDAKNDILMAEFFGFGISGVVASWVHKGMKESPREMANRIEQLVNSSKQLLLER